MDDNSSNSGRVKGAIKDRLKSFLYRKRYRIKLEKSAPVKKETKVKFNSYKKFKISNVRDLKALGDKVIKVDLKTEKFDFEKYDYYIIEPVRKKGIDIKTKEEAERKKKSVESVKEKAKSAKNIVNEVKIDITNKKEAEKKLIKQKEEVIKKRIELEKEIKRLKSLNVDYAYINEVKINSMKDINDATKIISFYENELKKYDTELNFKRKAIYSKIFDLKKEIYSLNIEGINIDALDNIRLLNEDDIELANKVIDYYEIELEKYKKNLDIVNAINTAEFVNPVGVEVENEEEIKIEKVEKREKLEENEIVEEKKQDVDKESKITLYKSNDQKIENKKLEVINKYDGKVIKVLKRKDDKIKENLNQINNIIKEMDKEVEKVTKEVREVTRVEGYGRMISSTLRVAAGVLTLPFSRANIFNIALGTTLINRGISGLRRGLETRQEIVVDYDYIDLSEKIRNTQNKLELTEVMIKDSLSQISMLKTYENLGVENLSKLKNLEQSLNRKLKAIDNINTKLKKQDEKNKTKIKKVERKEY